MKTKIPKRNPVQFLLNEAGRSDAWIVAASGCSFRSLENWKHGDPISRAYRYILERLAKREEARMAAAIIKEAGK